MSCAVFASFLAVCVCVYAYMPCLESKLDLCVPDVFPLFCFCSRAPEAGFRSCSLGPLIVLDNARLVFCMERERDQIITHTHCISVQYYHESYLYSQRVYPAFSLMNRLPRR